MKLIIGNKSLYIFIFLLSVTIICGCSGNAGHSGDVARRGIVLYTNDIETVGVETWIDFMKKADLNLLGIHGFNENGNLPQMEAFIKSDNGKLLIDECRKNNIDIEFETHALHLLLPRELFDEHPGYFRTDRNGIRTNDLNMCFSSEEAFSEIEKNLLSWTEWMKPSTNRYFFWTDDADGGFCYCDKCKKYTESEQALIYENRLLKILRKINPDATVAHLAYNNTGKAPRLVKPENGVFLEYAPIDRDLTKPMKDEHVRRLAENLEVFPVSTAHVLEYWIDASKFSHWDSNNIVRIPWNREICDSDVKMYSGLGIKSVTSFGAWINGKYLDKFGIAETRQTISEYGQTLKKYIN
jgi:hypothetical protein